MLQVLLEAQGHTPETAQVRVLNLFSSEINAGIIHPGTGKTVGLAEEVLQRPGAGSDLKTAAFRLVNVARDHHIEPIQPAHTELMHLFAQQLHTQETTQILQNRNEQLSAEVSALRGIGIHSPLPSTVHVTNPSTPGRVNFFNSLDQLALRISAPSVLKSSDNIISYLQPTNSTPETCIIGPFMKQVSLSRFYLIYHSHTFSHSLILSFSLQSVYRMYGLLFLLIISLTPLFRSFKILSTGSTRSFLLPSFILSTSPSPFQYISLLQFVSLYLLICFSHSVISDSRILSSRQ